MTTNHQPRPDWSKLNLPPEYMQEIHRYQQLEAKLRMATVIGSAFLHYSAAETAPQAHYEAMRHAWHKLIEQEKPDWE